MSIDIQRGAHCAPNRAAGLALLEGALGHLQVARDGFVVGVLSRRQCGGRKGAIPGPGGLLSTTGLVLRRQLRAGVRLLIPQRRRRHALRRLIGMVAAHGAAGQVPRKAPAAAAAARGVGFLGPTTRGMPRRRNARGRAARRQSGQTMQRIGAG